MPPSTGYFICFWSTHTPRPLPPACRSLPCTRTCALPNFLVFPVPEICLANVLVLPLAMAGTVLLMQQGQAGRQALGGVGVLVLLAYLGLVLAVLLAVSERHKMDWIRYRPFASSSLRPGFSLSRTGTSTSSGSAGQGADRGGSNGGGGGSSIMWLLGRCLCAEERQGLVQAQSGRASPAEDSCSLGGGLLPRTGHNGSRGPARPRDELTASGKLLLRFAPPHAHGCWETPELEVQRRLRQAYQSECCGLCLCPCLCLGGPSAACQHAAADSTSGAALLFAEKGALLRLIASLWSTKVVVAEQGGAATADKVCALHTHVLLHQPQSILQLTTSPAWHRPQLMRFPPSHSTAADAALRLSPSSLPWQVSQDSLAPDPQQVLVVQIQDRFGTLFMDYRGTSKACFMFTATKLVATALRGVLLGVFVGGWAAPVCKPWHRLRLGGHLLQQPSALCHKPPRRFACLSFDCFLLMPTQALRRTSTLLQHRCSWVC
jgi:hypothetical protein